MARNQRNLFVTKLAGKGTRSIQRENINCSLLAQEQVFKEY